MYCRPRRSNSALGVLKDQSPVTYGKLTRPFDLDFGPLNFDAALAYVKAAGFSDILTTDDGRIIFSGPADVVYGYSPRAAIEGQLNPYMKRLDEKKVRLFWETVSRVLNPAVDVRFGTLYELISGPYAPSVIPHPGKPETDFYSIDKRMFYAGEKTPFKIDLCSSVAGEKYSSNDGPVLLRTPAGYLVSVAHIVGNHDVGPIIACGGLAWASWAIDQGLHDFSGSIAFYADTRILMRNLGFRKPSTTRQKAVQFAAWDNHTLLVSKYDKFMDLLSQGMRSGSSGSGFLVAEYLAVGLDTTNFEGAGPYTDLGKKGQAPAIHTWDEVDDVLRNLDRVRRKKEIETRFPRAEFDTHNYVEMKTEDLIPLSDIPLIVIMVNRLNVPGLSLDGVKARFKSAGFEGQFIEVNIVTGMKDVDRAVEFFARNQRRFITAAPSITSGIVTEAKQNNIVPYARKAKFIQLRSGLIVSDIEVTQQLYESVTGKNPSNFKGNNNPVEKVSWFDCIEFCNNITDLTNKRFGYNRRKAYTIIGDNVQWDRTADGWRLPTEKEWEYAAKGNMDSFIPSMSDINDYAWIDLNSNRSTHPVAKKKSNINNLYDMLGNVYEWCWTPSDDFGIVFRGGSWGDGASGAQAGARGYGDPDAPDYYLGFRIYRNGPGYTPVGD